MATKSITTPTGKIIKIDFERKVQDKVSYADGYNLVVGREIVEYTNIRLCDANNKILGQSDRISPLYPQIKGSNDGKAMEQGAVGKIGNVYIRQEMADIIAAALNELEVENPKSEEQLAIEAAKAEAEARWEAELPERMAYEAFMRRMDDPNSDL